MNNFLKLTVFLASFITISGFNLTAPHAELIEPTRSIKGSAAEPGHLTVFSEPPGLNVKLDGASVGKTPIRIKALDPGIHQLEVKESVTEINIEPGQTFHISLFKNKFIPLPVVKKGPAAPAAPSDANALSATESRVSEPSALQLRIKEENHKAYERWMLFINGSSEHF